MTQNSIGYKVTKTPKLEPIARILLMGVYDDNNIFSQLRGIRYILKQIWELTLEFNKIYWKPFIKVSMTECYMSRINWRINFPQPKDININMMPFIMSNEFTETKLPNYLKSYYYHIIKRLFKNWSDDNELNKIGFLTVQESFVNAGFTQRRPGLHTETPGNIYTNQNKNIQKKCSKGGGKNIKKKIISVWGRGSSNYYQHTEGLYMTSSVSYSTAIWNCKIIRINNKDIIGHTGDIQHLRSSLPKFKNLMTANYLYWLTDRTPHEALPMDKPVYRQFFRLITSNVNVWHQQHSTINPNGVVPDPNITLIIKENKFK